MIVECAAPTASANYAKRFARPEAALKYANRFNHGRRKRIHEQEARAVQTILDALPARESVLDLPCGAGRFFPVLARRFASIIAADISTEFLHLAGGRARSAGVNVALTHADATATGFPDRAVDCVFCNRLLHHLPSRDERLKVLREIHRVSRRFAIVSFFDYQRFLFLRLAIKRLQGRRTNYDRHPSFQDFLQETAAAGFSLRQTVQVRPVWAAQKFLLLEKQSTLP